MGNFWGEFRLLDSVNEEDADRVRRQIMYYDGTYAVAENSSEQVKEMLERQFITFKNDLPDYVGTFFPIEQKSAYTASELNGLENQFKEKINEGKIKGGTYAPDSRELDVIIEGRVGIVLQNNDSALAGQLANNYLQYVLEYNCQKKVDKDTTIYYSGMAILAAQVQYVYADTDEERIQILEWIYWRYQEINDLGMTNDIQRVTDIMEGLQAIKVAIMRS